MLTGESLEGVAAIVGQHEAELNERVGAAIQARGRVALAKETVAIAKDVVKQAERDLRAIEGSVLTLGNNKQHTERNVENTAREIAVAIADDPTIEPLPKTLFSLIYDDRKPAWGDEDAYAAAAERGRVAMNSILERLEPGTPILYLGAHTTSGVASESGLLTVSPPVIERDEHSSYVGLRKAEIAISFQGASKAKSTSGNLVAIEDETSQVTLLSHMHGEDLDHLEEAANNDQWLVIGKEGILAKLEMLKPAKQLAALTALRATGVEISFEIEAAYRDQVESDLVDLVAFLASGVGQETTSRTARHHTMHGENIDTQEVRNNLLTAQAKEVNRQSIKHMSYVVGLDRDSLLAKVRDRLSSRANQANTPMDQVAKDLQTATNAKQLLDVIFDTESGSAAE